MNNTFFNDFTIADHFGVAAIQDTYDRAFNEWHDDYKMLTWLVITLNHKLWQHYENSNKVYMDLYNRLWETADRYAIDNLKGEELQYFLEVTD